jgi:succinyl-CoA synthetase beta subunit
MNAGLVLLDDDPNVKVIFVNIYGGMVDCFKVVTSVLYCHRMGDLSKQVVLRLKGLNSDMVKEKVKLP